MTGKIKMGKKPSIDDQIHDFRFASLDYKNRALKLEKELPRYVREVADAVNSGNTRLAENRAKVLLAKRGHIDEFHELACTMESIATQLEGQAIRGNYVDALADLSKTLDKLSRDSNTRDMNKVVKEFADKHRQLRIQITAGNSRVCDEEPTAEDIDNLIRECIAGEPMPQHDIPESDLNSETVTLSAVAEGTTKAE